MIFEKVKENGFAVVKEKGFLFVRSYATMRRSRLLLPAFALLRRPRWAVSYPYRPARTEHPSHGLQNLLRFRSRVRNG